MAHDETKAPQTSSYLIRAIPFLSGLLGRAIMFLKGYIFISTIYAQASDNSINEQDYSNTTLYNGTTNSSAVTNDNNNSDAAEIAVTVLTTSVGFMHELFKLLDSEKKYHKCETKCGGDFDNKQTCKYAPHLLWGWLTCGQLEQSNSGKNRTPEENSQDDTINISGSDESNKLAI